MTDTAIVERTWGLLPAIPSRKQQFYGPNFTFKEYMRAPNWFRGMAQHVSMTIFGMLLVIAPLRRLAWRFVRQPGQGPDRESAEKDSIEYRGVASPDIEGTSEKAFCRAYFDGSMYYREYHLEKSAWSLFTNTSSSLRAFNGPGGTDNPRG